MIKVQVTDGLGSGQSGTVKDNATIVSQYGCPPMIEQKNKIFEKYLTDDGTTSGSNDMGIDGSATAKEFYIKADSENDIYVTKISFIVGYGGSTQPYLWVDSAGALTNGFRFCYERRTGKVDIHPAIKNNADLMRLGVKDMLPTAWELRGIGGNNDYGYLVTVDFLSFMPPYGVKLDAGTNQRIIFEVRDNNGDADTMNAVAYGFERFA